MSAKRPLEGGVEVAAKKMKSDPSPDGSTTPADLSPDYIAKKRAEVAAMMANFSAQRTAKPTTLPPLVPPKPQSSLAPPPPSLPARPTSATPEAAPKGPPGIDPDLAKKVAEAKRRAMASLQSKAISSNPYLSAAAAATKKKPGTPAAEPAPQGAGLKMAAHPLLLNNAPMPAPTSKKDRHKPMLPKFASIKANAKHQSPAPAPVAAVETKQHNPYAPGSGSATPGEETPEVFKDRVSRAFRFNQKGKYIALGSQLRQEAQLEELKQRIAESAKKAGLDADKMEKSIKIATPPDVEWWDAALLPSKSYVDVKYTPDGVPDLTQTLISSSDSPITLYVQHPIPIPAPFEKNKMESKPLVLTKQEAKKMRRQRRQAELKDKQDRQRMGLIAPDPPKVRLANLMRVLTTDAVQDPTKVEARVRREVAMRKRAHDEMNEERKITDEQRREKIEEKKVNEEKKGVFGAVYKIKTLTDPSHRFKVRKNAEQYGLTGICIFNPSFSLVIVEGSSKAVKQYNRLMTVRMRWTEAARDKAAPDADDEEDGVDGAGEQPGSVKKEEHGFSVGEDNAASLDDNTCDKVWEGPLRDRMFKGFRAKSCPSDSLAKEALGEKMASYWDVAKTFVREDEL